MANCVADAGARRTVIATPSREATISAVLFLTLLGGALRFLWLGKQSFWVDEVVTWNLLRHPFSWMVLHGIAKSESTPPLYYVLAWGWVRIFGWSAVGLRSLSAVAGTLMVPVAFLAGRSLVGVRAGLLTALLVALSPMLIWYSQEARAYALFALFAALSVWLFGHLLRGGARRTAAAWSVVCALSIATHYFAVFLVVAEALWLARHLTRSVFVRAVAAPVAVCLVLAPLAYAQRANAGGLAATAGLGRRIGTTAAWFASGDLRSPLIWGVVGMATLTGLTLLFDRRVQSERSGGLTAFALVCVAAALPLMLALGGKDYVFFRNMIALWLPLAMALAAGFSGFRKRAVGLVAAGALVAAFLTADATVWANSGQQRDDYRNLVRVLRIAPETAVLVYPGWDITPLLHYGLALEYPHTAVAPVRELDFIGVNSNFGAWLSPSRVRLNTPAGFRLRTSRTYQHFVVRRYTSNRPRMLLFSHLEHLVAPRNTTATVPPLRIAMVR